MCLYIQHTQPLAGNPRDASLGLTAFTSILDVADFSFSLGDISKDKNFCHHHKLLNIYLVEAISIRKEQFSQGV